MMKITAGVVTFNPDIERLRNNVEALLSQPEICKIIITDNFSDNIEEIVQLAKQHDERIILIRNERNLGIASALNTIMNKSREGGADWVLTCDQDSIIPDNLISSFLKYTQDMDAAIICPVVYDVNLNMEYGNTLFASSSDTELMQCITSGSLNRLAVWEEVGGFDEFLFIDWVDFDFCYRVRQNGYRIIRDQEVVLKHETGKARCVRFFNRTIVVTNHNSARRYYECRNRCRIDYKYLGKLRLWTVLHIIKLTLLILCFEDDKGRKIRACWRGFKDGIKSRKEL